MAGFVRLLLHSFSFAADTKYSASKLYEAYLQFCQALGRKPQSTNAFKKALEKLPNVYQHRASSGMQWHGIQPVIHLLPPTNVGILENFSGDFSDLPTLPTFPTLLSLFFNEEGVLIYKDTLV